MFAREKVSFEINQPRVVRLDNGIEGRRVVSRLSGSTQWQYVVNENTGIMWLPLAGYQALQRSNAQPGHAVEIVKSFVDRQTVFSATVVPDGALDDPNRTAPPPPPAPAPRRSNGNYKGLPGRAYYQPETAPGHPPDYENEPPKPGAGAGGAERHSCHVAPPRQVIPIAAAPASTPPNGTPTKVHPIEELLTRCIIVAGRATFEARRTLIEEGYAVPEAEWKDVRAAGISVFIERTRAKQGGR